MERGEGLVKRLVETKPAVVGLQQPQPKHRFVVLAAPAAVIVWRNPSKQRILFGFDLAIVVSEKVLDFCLELKSNIMPLVSHTCVAPAPAVVPLEVLVQLQDVSSTVTFESPNDNDPAVMIKTVTVHPVTSQESMSTSVSWVGCARSLSHIVPSLGLWGTDAASSGEVESWVEGAASILLPYLEASSAGMTIGV